jgi:hypothetical protein
MAVRFSHSIDLHPHPHPALDQHATDRNAAKVPLTVRANMPR